MSATYPFVETDPVASATRARLDAVGAVSPSQLPGVPSAGSVRRIYARNDIRNPRAIGLNGWSKTDPTGGTGASLTAITGDADVGDGVEYTVTHDGSASRVIRINFSDTSATYGIPVQKEHVVFHRCKVKNTAKPGGAGDIIISLNARFLTSGGADAGLRGVCVRPRFDAVGATQLEGFDNALVGAAWCGGQASFALPAVAGVYTFRVGKAQTVVDPENEVPEYVDGTSTLASWSGTANQSVTEGYADPPTDPLPFGFNDNVHQAARVPRALTPAQDVALMQEIGATIWRFGTSPTDANLPWPTEGDGPDWRRHAGFAAMLDALEEAGLQALPIIGTAPAWMTTGGTGFLIDVPPSRYDELAALYNALIAEWPTVITAVEWSNEPNFSGALSWQGPADPVKYTETMIAGYDAIKAAHPSVTFVGGSLGRYQANDANGMVAGDFLQGMYDHGAKGKMDAIAIHPYPTGPSTAITLPRATGFVTGFDEVMQQIREVRRTNADEATPLWVTEVGMVSDSSYNELMQAQAMMLIRGILRRASDVDVGMFHTLTGDTTENNAFEFLEYRSLRRKPVWHAIRDSRLPGGSWRRLALAGTWVPFNATASGWDPRPRYRLDPATREVEVRGAIKSGATATSLIATLPPGFRPGENLEILGEQGSTGVANISGASAVNPATIRIGADGQIFPVVNTSTTYLAFNGKFRAEK